VAIELRGAKVPIKAIRDRVNMSNKPFSREEKRVAIILRSAKVPIKAIRDRVNMSNKPFSREEKRVAIRHHDYQGHQSPGQDV
jgi:hypothetical protein